MKKPVHSQGFTCTHPVLTLVSFVVMAALNLKASTVVVPNGMDAREGSGSSGILNQAGREQTVYAATNFPSGPISITELHFRPNVTDYMPGSAFSATIWDLQIVLSTTPVHHGGLNAAFSNNTGPDATTVVSGPVTLFSTFTGPDTGPKDFDIVIPLSHPFTYDPARGNLLVDIQNFSGDPTSPVDAEYSTNGAASRVVSSSPISASGVADDDADVLQIVYSQAIITNPPPLAVPGYVSAVLRSGCADSPPVPPKVGEIATGDGYVIMTVGYGDPDDWQNAQLLANDAAFESIMPLYCALPKTGCVTDEVQWNIITYEADGSPHTSGCAASGCQFRSCMGFESGAPVIVTEPVSQSVNSGQFARFSVDASGAAPLSYQWVFDGTNALAGATNAVLVLPHAHTNQSGIYAVEVSNSLGMTNSAAATLTVNPGLAATNGYITAVLRSECTSDPTPPPPLGGTNIGPDYVIATVADADPSNFENAQQVATDAVFESLMPLYCALAGNSGAGCVTNRVQWNIVTYDTNGNPMISGCAASGCDFHYCGGGTGTPLPALTVAPATNNIGIYWPSEASDFILEGSSNLANWYPVGSPVITNGDRVSTQMPAPGQSVFYRLRHK